MQGRVARNHKRATAAASLALMLVDGTGIRQRIKREYEKVLRDLERARGELNRFQKEDAPNFNRWVNRQFGSLLTEVRETDRRICELRQLFLEVETEILFSGLPAGQAYARVMENRKNPKPSPEESTEEEEKGRGTGAKSRSSHYHDDGFDEAEPDFEEFFGFGRKKPERPSRNVSPTLMGRLKELYRALARRLHPDAQREMTPQKEEWWHQAQAAYEKGDTEQLEVILSLCEIEATGTTEKTSLSVLQRISLQLKKTLRQLRTQLSKHRRDPAWNFNKKADNSALTTTMRRQLTHDLQRMKEAVQVMELEMATWAAKSRRRRSPGSRVRRTTDPLEFFF